MARDHGRIRYSIWSDPDFRALREAEQRLFMLALSQAGLSYVGVVPYTIRRWQGLAADSSMPKLRKTIGALEEARYVVVDEDTEELLIRSFLRNDGLLDNPNMVIASVKDYGNVQSPMLRAVIAMECYRMLSEDPRVGNKKSWDEVLLPWLTEAFPVALLGALPPPLIPRLRKVYPEGLDEALSSARVGLSPYPSPGVNSPRRGKPSAGEYCEVHLKDEPCSGCAADRKAASQ